VKTSVASSVSRALFAADVVFPPDVTACVDEASVVSVQPVLVLFDIGELFHCRIVRKSIDFHVVLGGGCPGIVSAFVGVLVFGEIGPTSFQFISEGKFFVVIMEHKVQIPPGTGLH